MNAPSDQIIHIWAAAAVRLYKSQLGKVIDLMYYWYNLFHLNIFIKVPAFIQAVTVYHSMYTDFTTPTYALIYYLMYSHRIYLL
jgi:hypothetical protein